MPTVNSEGVAIDYEIINPQHTNTPVFLITGLGGIRGIWAKQFDAFSATRPLILHDHRGTGKSDKPSGVYSVPNMAKDIIAIMNDLEIEQAHLVGSSTGGSHYPGDVYRLSRACQKRVYRKFLAQERRIFHPPVQRTQRSST